MLLRAESDRRALNLLGVVILDVDGRLVPAESASRVVGGQRVPVQGSVQAVKAKYTVSSLEEFVSLEEAGAMVAKCRGCGNEREDGGRLHREERDWSIRKLVEAKE